MGDQGIEILLPEVLVYAMGGIFIHVEVLVYELDNILFILTLFKFPLQYFPELLYGRARLKDRGSCSGNRWFSRGTRAWLEMTITFTGIFSSRLLVVS